MVTAPPRSFGSPKTSIATTSRRGSFRYRSRDRNTHLREKPAQPRVEREDGRAVPAGEHRVQCVGHLGNEQPGRGHDGCLVQCREEAGALLAAQDVLLLRAGCRFWHYSAAAVGGGRPTAANNSCCSGLRVVMPAAHGRALSDTW